MVALGTEKYTYEVAEGWGRLPEGWGFKEVGGVGADAKDNVYVFNRGEHPMIVFDREGNFLRSWGARGSSPGPTASPWARTIPFIAPTTATTPSGSVHWKVRCCGRWESAAGRPPS